MATQGRPLPCAHCGGAGAKCCKGCRLAYFCSRDCQRAAWPQHSAWCTSKKGRTPGPKLELVDIGGGKGAGLRCVCRPPSPPDAP